MKKRRGAGAIRLGSFAMNARSLQPRSGGAAPAGLVRGRRRGPAEAVPWWAWPSLLALDAPAVAATWLWAIGDATGHPVAPQALLLVAAAVWLAYVADRLLDARRMDARSTSRPPWLRRSSRHAFFARHRRRLGRTWTWVLGGCVTVSAVVLSPSAFALGLLVAILAVASLAWNDRATAAGALGRCLAIGVAFAGAIAVGLDAPADPALLAPVLGFGAVCASNVAWVAAWERHLDDGHATHARAEGLAHALALVALLTVAAWWVLAPSALGLAALAALAGLVLLEAAGDAIAPRARSAAADLVLVLPLLVVLV